MPKKDTNKKLINAIENYKKIMKDIAPFIKKKQEKRYSTKGNWTCGGSWERIYG